MSMSHEQDKLSIPAVIAALPMFLLLAAGPFPMKFAGVLIDHLVSALTLGVVAISVIAQPGKKQTKIAWCVLLYLCSLLPSVPSADDLTLASREYVKTVGYAALFFLYVVMRRPFIREIQVASSISFLTIGALVIYLYNFSSYSGAMRFGLYSDYADVPDYGEQDGVDPNMTAFGLLLVFLAGFPLLVSGNGGRVKYMATIAVPMLLYTSVVLMSRTAILCVALLGAVYTTRNLIGLIDRPNSLRKVTLRAMVLPVSIGITVYAMVSQDAAQAIVERFEDVLNQESQETGRLWLVEQTVRCYFHSVGSVLWGCGYAWSNPHNDFLKDLVNSGFFAAAARIILLVTVFMVSRRNAIRQAIDPLVVDMTFVALTVMSLTYGHTKTFWLGLALIWLGGHAAAIPSGAKNQRGQGSEGMRES